MSNRRASPGTEQPPEGSRLAELSRLVGELQDRPGNVSAGDFNALAVMLADAALDADEATLVAGQRGLQRVYGRQLRVDDPSPEQVEQRGRVLGFIDLVQWLVRRVIPAATLSKLEPSGHAHRFLSAIATRPGLSNTELARELGVDETEVSRVGRRLHDAGLARKRKLGRHRRWDVTPRGAQALQLEGGRGFCVSLDPKLLPVLAKQLVELDEVRHQPVLSKIFPAFLLASEPLSPADVAKQTNLSERAVELAVALLIARGYIIKDGDGVIDKSRPLSVNTDGYGVLGVEILPERLTGVMMNLRGKVLREIRRELASKEPEDVLEAVRELVAELRTPKRGKKLPDQIIGLGVELGGHIDGQRGEVVFSPNLEWRKAVPVAPRLRKSTGLVTVVENDANALAIFEQLFGFGSGADSFGVILLDEGIGCGLIVDGQLLHGASGIAGELGHVVIDPDGPECRCGKHGCLEALASTQGILNQIEHLSGVKPRTLDEAASLADRGDPDAQRAFANAGEALGRGISLLENVLNPERILVSVPAALQRGDRPARKLFEAAARKTAKKHAFSSADARCEVAIRYLPVSDEYRACGAASTVLRRFIHRPLDWRPVRTLGEAGSQEPEGMAARPPVEPLALLAGLSSVSRMAEPIVLRTDEAGDDPLGMLGQMLLETSGR